MPSKSQRHHFLAAFVLGSLGLMTALSLFPTRGSNFLGPVGSESSGFLYLALGLCAWAVPLALLLFSWRYFHSEPVAKPGWKVLGAVLGILSISIPLHILPSTPMREGVGWGGKLGEWTGLRLETSLGWFGALVAAFLLFVLASWLLEKEMHLLRFFQWVGNGMGALAVLLIGLAVKIGTRSAKSVRESYADWQTRRAAKKAADEARRKLHVGQGRDPGLSDAGPEYPAKKARIAAAFPPDLETARARSVPFGGSERPGSPAAGHPGQSDLERGSYADEEAERPPTEEGTGPAHSAPLGRSGPADIRMEEEEDAVASKKSKKSRVVRTWNLPPVHLLKGEREAAQAEADDYEAVSRTLMETLRNFGVETTVVGANPGPTVTQYEVQPAAGVKISDIASLEQDLALALQVAQVRAAPIPGKAAVGVEVPNRKGRVVTLKEMLVNEEFAAHPNKLRVAVGKDIAGTPVYCNLNEMPHLLIAGATGSGKSVCVNSTIASLLFRATPDEVRFLLVDPKRVEMTVFQKLPHLAVPVVNDPKEAHRALKWLVEEMEDRYHKLAHAGVRDIDSYNAKMLKRRAEGDLDAETCYYIVVLIDELADLMMTAKDQVEDAIARLAQMARAVGIHLVLATQRPSVEVITGTIKANFPSRIAFQVFSKVDSRTILDMNGAEALLGRGDMLYLPSGTPKPLRLQGAYVTVDEIERLADFWNSQGTPDYAVDLSEKARDLVSEDSEDELYDEAMQAVVLAKQASTSLLQRRLKIGYGRAARLLDDMEKRGIVGPPDGNKPRKVLVKSLGDLPGGEVPLEVDNDEAEETDAPKDR